MTAEIKATWQSLYVIMNPASGNADGEAVHLALGELCQKLGCEHEIYETSGDEDLAQVVHAACERGASLVIAAGGDGTVAAAVNGLIGTGVPLAIIPVGTGNGLARAMNIPLQVKGSIELLGGDYEVAEIDAMQVGDKYYVLNVSAGMSAHVMKNTRPEDKQQRGLLAYVETMVKDLPQREPSVFDLELDGHRFQVRAIEVLVANGQIFKEPPYLFGARPGFYDSRLEVNILTASKPAEFVRLAWDLLIDPDQRKTDLRDLTVKERIRLGTQGEPLPVQADGEVIGQTPVEIRLAPGAIRMVVPRLNEKEETN